MKTEQTLYSDSEKIETQSKGQNHKADCGLFIGNNLVCDRCGVPYASHT